MADKSKPAASMADALMEAAQAITRAMGSPEAADPKIAGVLGKLQTAVLGVARGPAAPMPGAAPGGAPGGGPPGAGMGPPGGGAANPAMGAMTGGQPSPPPGAGASMGIPQMPPDELRRMLAQQT